MSSDKFDYIIIQIPKGVTISTIKTLNSFAEELDTDSACIMNEILGLESQNVLGENLEEDDLFEIGEEALLVKKTVQLFLKEAVSKILTPRISSEQRVSSPLTSGEFSYIELDGKAYVIAGQYVGVYTSRLSAGYKYVLALSLSGILEKYLSD
tara:strand:- start:2792 stop:3250 length:459 start_codon:yes stop_codon:yes gene_type:complete